MIVFSSEINDVKKEQLEGFFVGWASPLTIAEHYDTLKNSTHFIVAIDDDSNKVVGFITALTDKVNAAFIPLLEVLPEYQNKGIGSELVKQIFSVLKPIGNIDLMCDENMENFYKRFGMIKSTGMLKRSYFKENKGATKN